MRRWNGSGAPACTKPDFRESKGCSGMSRSMKRLSRRSLFAAWCAAAACRRWRGGPIRQRRGQSRFCARLKGSRGAERDSEQARFLSNGIERVEERRSLNDTRAADVKFSAFFLPAPGPLTFPWGSGFNACLSSGYPKRLFEKLLIHKRGRAERQTAGGMPTKE